MVDRIFGRIQRILDYRAKLVTKLANFPKHPKKKGWVAKIAELDQSIANFEKYGQETVPSGAKAGVTIDVPAGKFTIEAKQPGG